MRMMKYFISDETTDVTNTPQDDCSPENGGYEITTLTVSTPGGGTTAVTGAGLDDYTFSWYDETGTLVNNANVFDRADAAINNQLAGAVQIQNVAAGNYYVEFTSNLTNCPSSGTQRHNFCHTHTGRVQYTKKCSITQVFW